MVRDIAQLGWKAYIKYRNSRWFLDKAKDQSEVKLRCWLLREFRNIERHIHCLHTEGEILFMTDYLLTNSIDGSMVECGSYQGGSSAKLSLVARVIDKKLYVCDSFLGLPPLASDDGVYHDMNGQIVRFSEGENGACMESVQHNVRRFGDMSRCNFVPGLFADTLLTLDVSPSFVFMDVDLISSARDCIRYLWPNLRSGARFFTHEAAYPEFITGIMDSGFWLSRLGETPPTIFGAGFGCGFDAGCIAYFDKRS